MERYDEFEQYIRATEPGPKERAELWQTAIGLQKVDGLEVSDYLVETAKKHIEGEVNIDDVDKLISTYYKSEAAREIPDDVKVADEVSKNIVSLGEKNELKNRYLHIRWNDAKLHFEVSETSKPHNDVSDDVSEMKFTENVLTIFEPIENRRIPFCDKDLHLIH